VLQSRQIKSSSFGHQLIYLIFSEDAFRQFSETAVSKMTHNNNKAIVDTSPALSISITAPSGDGMIPSAAWRYLQRARYNTLSVGKKTHQNCPFPLGFRNRAEGGPSHGHRQHAQKKGHVCGSGDMLAVRQTNRQTDKHTHTHTVILITILHPFNSPSSQ